jgi:hypothetical protein
MFTLFRPRPLSVSRRAVERRLCRRMAAENLVLRRCSPRSRWHSFLGDYYTVSTVVGAVFDTHQDLADLALDYGVIGERQQILGE